MNTFKVTYTDGTHYTTSANGTIEEFTAYLMQFGGIVTDENPVTGEETRRTIASVEQILKEEQAKNDAFFSEMDAKMKTAQDNTIDEQIWTTPNQRRLIAAAPELLEVLKAAVARMEENQPAKAKPRDDMHKVYARAVFYRDLQAARAALKKAEGK